MGIVVREAEATDGDALLELVDALADYEKLARPTAEARARLLRDGFGEEPRFHAFIAELDGRPVGYAITFHSYSSFLALPTLFLEDLFVVPDARGTGVGGALFRDVARQAVRDGCGRMEWVVLKWNRPALDFYERLGARRLDEWDGYRLTREQIEKLGTET